MEIWKDIIGYEGHYTISNYGNVKSYYFNNCLHCGDNGNGYKFIYLHKHGKGQRFYIHRLVAIMFIENLLNKPQVNHKDCNKANNYVENLEWMTKDENRNHAVVNKRFHSTQYQKQQAIKANSGTKSHLSILDDDKIREIRKLKLTGISNLNIGLKYNVNRETVGYILRGKTWKHVI
jgi:hypothetical protein